MIRIKKSIVFILVSLTVCFTQTPEWVKNSGMSNQYPQSLYVTGFGAAKVTKHTEKLIAEQIALETAKRNLSEKISVSISSKVLSVKEENRSQYSEFFSQQHSHLLQSISKGYRHSNIMTTTKKCVMLSYLHLAKQ